MFLKTNYYVCMYLMPNVKFSQVIRVNHVNKQFIKPSGECKKLAANFD